MAHSSEYSRQNQMTREKDQNIRILKHGGKEEELHTLASSLQQDPFKEALFIFSQKSGTCLVITNLVHSFKTI